MRNHLNLRPISALDPPIRISMNGDHLVIRPEGRLDHDAAQALIGAVDAAVFTGSTVLVDLDEQDRSPATGEVSAPRHPRPATGVVAAMPGCMRFGGAGSWWTIDVAARRVCRSATPIDPRFVAADLWIGVRRLWVSTASLTVLTTAGTFLTTRHHAC